ASKHPTELNTALYSIFVNWANAKGAEAFQTVMGKSVTLPAPEPVDIDMTGFTVIEHRGLPL
ncbi:hypothetical protein ABTL28_19480, partial [Acinetobacter baumannii]